MDEYFFPRLDLDEMQGDSSQNIRYLGVNHSKESLYSGDKRIKNYDFEINGEMATFKPRKGYNSKGKLTRYTCTDYAEVIATNLAKKVRNRYM